MEVQDGTPQNVSTGKTNDDLTKELEFLRNENYILKGRIRGCETLGTLLQESKQMNKKLVEEKFKLQQRLNDSLTRNVKNQTVNTNEDNTSFDNRRQENPEQIFTQVRKSAPLSVPMQESNNLEDVDVSAPLNFDLISTQNDQESNLEYDSAKFSDANYPEMKSSERIPTQYDPTYMVTFDNSMATSEPSSEHPIFLPTACEKEGNISAYELRSMTESLSEEQFQRKAAAWTDNLLKIKSENSQFKKLIKIVTEENQQFKSVIRNMRDENAKLLKKIKQLEHERDDLSPGSFVNDAWVHIKRESNMEEELFQEKAANAEIKLMRELKEANTAWREKWNSLERSHSVRNKQLEEKLKAVEDELKKEKLSHEKQLEEMDKMLLATKSRYEEEQDSKAEIAQELHLTKQRLTSLQTQITTLETENSKLNHSKHLLETELNALKNAREQPLRGNSRTLEEKDTEIMVLKEQIAVFHEDFEKERQDRASAQATKNHLKEENNKLKMEKDNYIREANALRQKVQDLKSDVSAKQSRIQSLNSEIQTSKLTISQLRQQRHRECQMVNQSPQPYFYEVTNAFRGFSNELPAQPTFEHLPGAWTCEACTYINYPGRTVCEICGYIRNIAAPSPGVHGYTGQNGQDLTPRGRTDVEIDTVM